MPRVNGHDVRACVIILPVGGPARWQSDCVRALQDAYDVAIRGVLVVNNVAGVPMPRRLPHRLQRLLDSATRPRLARQAGLPDTFTGTPQRHINPASDGHLALTAADTEWLSACEPDFLLSFDALPPAQHAALAPAGTWAFAVGNPPSLGNVRHGVREIGQRRRRLGLRLQRVTSTDAPAAVLAEGYTPITPYSRKRSLARFYEIGVDVLGMAIRGQRAGRSPVHTDPAGDDAPLSARHWAAFLAAIMRESLIRWTEKLLYRQQWRIGLIAGDTLVPSTRQIENARWLSNPDGVFWADPCFVPGDAHHLLVEECPHATERGRITALFWPDGCHREPPRTQTVRDTDGHLSFPRVYRRDGQLWLVPEMADQGIQQVYALDTHAQPLAQPARTIEGLCGIDPVLFEHDGHHWALASPAGRRANYQLELFCANGFFGPYRAHPANPIRIDPHGGRCAGPVIARDGRLYRFGQVLGRHYGEAIDVFKIVTLDPYHYAEQYIGRIQPAGGEQCGVHSIDFAGQTTVIDAFRLERRWATTRARPSLR